MRSKAEQQHPRQQKAATFSEFGSLFPHPSAFKMSGENGFLQLNTPNATSCSLHPVSNTLTLHRHWWLGNDSLHFKRMSALPLLFHAYLS